MAIIKISDEQGGIYAEEAIPDPREFYVGDELRAELEQIEAQLLALSKEPNEILVPNDKKLHEENMLNLRKNEINNILI